MAFKRLLNPFGRLRQLQQSSRSATRFCTTMLVNEGVNCPGTTPVMRLRPRRSLLVFLGMDLDPLIPRLVILAVCAIARHDLRSSPDGSCTRQVGGILLDGVLRRDAGEVTTMSYFLIAFFSHSLGDDLQPLVVAKVLPARLYGRRDVAVRVVAEEIIRDLLID